MTKSSYDFTPAQVRKGRLVYDFLPADFVAKANPNHAQQPRDCNMRFASGRPTVGPSAQFESHKPRVLFGKRQFSDKKRKHLAATGAAMAGGRFPIENAGDLHNAISDYNRIGQPPSVRAHILQRAKALGLPAPFQKSYADFLKADPDLSDGMSGGISHSESDRVGVQDDRTETEKAAQIAAICTHATATPPLPGETVDRWIHRLFDDPEGRWGVGEDGPGSDEALYSDQIHVLHCLFKDLKAYHHGVVAKVQFDKALAAPDLKEGLCWGWASVIEKHGMRITDHQDDRINEAELMKAAHDYVANSRTGGALHLYNEDKPNDPLVAGHVVESLVFTKELQKALDIDLGKVGWLIGYRITDPTIRKAVARGALPSFSIGGKGTRVAVDA